MALRLDSREGNLLAFTTFGLGHFAFGLLFLAATVFAVTVAFSLFRAGGNRFSLTSLARAGLGFAGSDGLGLFAAAASGFRRDHFALLAAASCNFGLVRAAALTTRGNHFGAAVAAAGTGSRSDHRLGRLRAAGTAVCRAQAGGGGVVELSSISRLGRVEIDTQGKQRKDGGKGSDFIHDFSRVIRE